MKHVRLFLIAAILALCSLSVASASPARGVVVRSGNFARVGTVYGGYRSFGFVPSYSYGYAAPAIVVQQAPLVTHVAPAVAAPPAYADPVPAVQAVPLAVAPAVTYAAPVVTYGYSSPLVFRSVGYGYGGFGRTFGGVRVVRVR